MRRVKNSFARSARPKLGGVLIGERPAPECLREECHERPPCSRHLDAERRESIGSVLVVLDHPDRLRLRLAVGSCLFFSAPKESTANGYGSLRHTSRWVAPKVWRENEGVWNRWGRLSERHLHGTRQHVERGETCAAFCLSHHRVRREQAPSIAGMARVGPLTLASSSRGRHHDPLDIAAVNTVVSPAQREQMVHFPATPSPSLYDERRTRTCSICGLPLRWPMTPPSRRL